MVLSDWTQCKYCQFPALYSSLRELTSKIPECPMCSHALKSSEIELMSEKSAKEWLHGKQEAIDKAEDSKQSESKTFKRASNRIESDSGAPGLDSDNPRNDGSILTPGMLGIGGLVA